MVDFNIDQLSIETSEKAILHEFVEAWDRHAQPVLFVGAGLSKYESIRRPDSPSASAFGTWMEILEDLRDRLSNGNLDIKRSLTTDPLRIAQLFQTQFDRQTLLARIRQHVPSADFSPGQAHKQLREIPWAAIVTTNYDDLLERAFEPTRPLRRIIADADLAGPRPLNELVVIKLHGDLSHPGSIVFSEEDYLNFEKSRPGLSVKVRQLLIEHPLLFLGFSLSDPNFARIDHWIRDTIGTVRLPAVSVIHNEPSPGERALWGTRGVKLVQLSRADSMARFLAALVAARPRRITGIATRQNERIPELEADVRRVAQTSEPNRTERIASLLCSILEGAASDDDGGADARRVAVNFCYGWNGLLGARVRRTAESLLPAVTAKAIYEHLTDHQRSTLLIMALEGGMKTLRIDVQPVDIVDKLLEMRLSSDERATVHLHQARLLRDLGRSADAAQAITAASECGSSRELRARIARERRELAFQDGDRAKLEAELRRPPPDDTDVLERCRRGSDCLLLGWTDEADDWYKQALERSTTGDERVAALWGRLVATQNPWTDTQEERTRSAELRRDLHSVPEKDQPATVQARKLAEQAGDALLDGESNDRAIERLQAYMDEMRRLGWPHTHRHDLTTPMEDAARQCARLLLNNGDAEDPTQGIIEAIVILNRYGLAHDIRKLFERKHCESLSQEPETVAWFRSFVAATPTIPRCADARLATAVAGIAMLTDEAIESTVVSVIAQMDSWLAASTTNHITAPLAGWWQDVVAAFEHLPVDAAMRVLDAHGRYLLNPRATARIGSPPSTWFWLRQGFLQCGGPESHRLAERGSQALENALRKPQDSFWLRTIIDSLEQAARDGLFGEADRAMLHDMVRAALENEVARTKSDDGSELHIVALQLAALLAALHPEHRIEATCFAVCVNDIVIRNLRSSLFGLSLRCAEAALGAMSSADHEVLLDVLCNVGEHLVADRNDGVGTAGDRAEVVARVIAAISTRSLAARERIASLLFRLADRYPNALIGLGRLPTPSPGEIARSARIVETALFSAREARRDQLLLNITGWLHSRVASTAAESVLDVALGLCLSDASETRAAAVYAVADFFRVNTDSITPIRSRALRIVSELAARDPAWSVRIRALTSLPHLCTTAAERAELDASISSMGESLVALERRARAETRTRLAAVCVPP